MRCAKGAITIFPRAITIFPREGGDPGENTHQKASNHMKIKEYCAASPGSQPALGRGLGALGRGLGALGCGKRENGVRARGSGQSSP